MKIDKTTVGLVYNGGFYPLACPLRVTYSDGTILRGEVVCISFVSSSSRPLLTFKLSCDSRFVTFYGDEIESAVLITDLEVAK